MECTKKGMDLIFPHFDIYCVLPQFLIDGEGCGMGNRRKGGE
jgi:hypothetical protein